MSENIIGKVVSPFDLVTYQDGSVVSRIILMKDSGSVTLFAFDKGQNLSEHTAPFDAMVNILEGEAEVTISGNSMIVKSGETVTMPANKPHSIQAPDRFKMMLIMIKS